VFNKFKELKKKPYWGNKFWVRGYCVDTVGLDESKIRATTLASSGGKAFLSPFRSKRKSTRYAGGFFTSKLKAVY